MKRKMLLKGLLLALCLWWVPWEGETMPAPASTESHGEARPQSSFPVLTGAVAVLVVFLFAWMQARYRQRVEESNARLRRSEEQIRQLNHSLEMRIAERTAELAASEARLRTLVDYAPEAIVLFDAEAGGFVTWNENALRLFNLTADQLACSDPGQLSPGFQPDGRPSVEGFQEKIQQALRGDAPAFDWYFRGGSGKNVACEVRLVRLPAEGKSLVRGSILDQSERRRRESIQKAVYQISEAVHTVENLESLFPRIHQIIQGLMPSDNFYIALHDPATGCVNFPYFVDQRDRPPAPFSMDTGLTSHVIRTGKPLLTDQRAASRKKRLGGKVILEGIVDTPFIEAGSPAAVWLGAPLNMGNTTFGVMAVQDYSDGTAYGEEEKRILTFVAEQTALAIERKRAEQALKTRSEQIARHRNVLLELAQLDKSDFPKAMRKICEFSSATLEAARVSYWSLQENNSAIVCELLYLGGRNELDTAFAGTRIEASSCPAYFEAVVSKQPIVASDALVHPATAELAVSYLRPLGISSMLDAPVWVHGKMVGVLCHEHIGIRREWTLEEIDFASSLGTMVSLASEAAQRARSENALRESEEKHRALFEATSQGVMLHDENQFLEVNPAAVRILGFSSAEEIIGKHPADTSAPIQPGGQRAWELARKHVETALQHGSTRFEWLTRRPDGVDLPIEVFLTTIPLNNKRIIQAVINDISDRKKAERELLKSLAREKDLSQLKSDFVSMVSHEFRTPLGIIMSSAEILEAYFNQLEPEERGEHLRSIQKNTRRMAALMEEVLLLGKVEAGKLECKPELLDLPGFLRKIRDEVTSAMGEARIELSIDPGVGVVMADQRLLQHIFANLLTNAIKYSPGGAPVYFQVERNERLAVCTVRDQGIGIPSQDQQFLFAAFHRGSNAGHVPGTGLGLTIVKRCVELHQGEIQIQSAVSQGTTVTVKLPLFPPSNTPLP